ncbi:MAG TPA: SAM-dependent methyltransferase [Allosphingosinicella sp.]|jgi:NADH dehydrogenase [ubiquinone] 1 alpha subcomplex assembly factor 7|nr:SAM-dependent methyltransferase [Allosphingosinicella sp.]
MIASHGPIPVSDYMALANAHYYATRDPLGAAGDFTTAPEISQMFGELVGLALADQWVRAGRPQGVRYVELGPGRGTLAADALRAMRAAGLEPEVHFVETSPVLRAAQAERVPDARWHDDLHAFPDGGPVLAVANEFFDALPVRQLVATGTGWRERLVALDGDRFVPVAGPPVPAAAIPAHVRAAPPGTLLETSPASLAHARLLARRITMHGGGALVVDYGHDRLSAGETLQAVRMHDYADPWRDPGEADLTAHVDFESLAAAASEAGARVLGPVAQGDWLARLGIDARADALARSAPHRGDELRAARDRLVSPEQMGRLFRVMGISAPAWPDLEGFQ